MKTILLTLLMAASTFADTPPPVYQFNSPLTKTGANIGCQVASGSQAGCIAASDWSSFNGKVGVPAGGTTGQVLSKNSNTSGDLIWATASGGGGGLGAPAEMSLTYNPYWWGVPATFYGVNSDQDQTNQIVYYGSTDTASLTNNTSAILINTGAVATSSPASGVSGDIYIVTGSQQNSASTGGTGQVYIATGDLGTGTPGGVSILGGQNVTTHVGGPISIGSNQPSSVNFISPVAYHNYGSFLVNNGDQLNPYTGSNSSSLLVFQATSGTTLAAKSIVDGTADGQILIAVNYSGNSYVVKKSATVNPPGGADYTMPAHSVANWVWANSTWWCTGVSAD